MLNVSEPLIGEEERQAVARVLSGGQLAQGPEVAALEEEFAAYVGAAEAVAVASGTESLRLALAALGVGRGDEVIIPAFTFVATATTVLMVGATPVIVDVDEETCTMDPASAEAAVTEKTRALMPVHLYGHPADLGPMLDLCEDQGLALVEDACQAHGARFRGKRVGSVGACGCFSFYPTKNMTTGEGGMVTTQDPGLAKLLRMLRHHGMAGPYDYRMVGYNSRMTDLGAAIGRVQLAKLDTFNAKRRENAARLTNALSDLVATPTEAEWAEHVYHQYTVCTDRRDALREHLAAEGVGSGVYYPQSLDQVGMLRGKARTPAEVEVTRSLCAQVLSLPVHPGLDEADVGIVIGAVRSFFD